VETAVKSWKYLWHSEFREDLDEAVVIVTTNLGFSRWVGIFFDEEMTVTIIDRLLHHFGEFALAKTALA
jgi:DNA replication protein DnaC